jgi:hypothetical protein
MPLEIFLLPFKLGLFHCNPCWGFLPSHQKELLVSLAFFASIRALFPLLSTPMGVCYFLFDSFSNSKMLKLQVCSASLCAIEAPVYGPLPHASGFIVREPDFRISMGFCSLLASLLPSWLIGFSRYSARLMTVSHFYVCSQSVYGHDICFLPQHHLPGTFVKQNNESASLLQHLFDPVEIAVLFCANKWKFALVNACVVVV